jgi:hypothetical protein
MKHYYTKHSHLCWVESGTTAEKSLIAAGYERITRRAAIEQCSIERWRRKNNPSFAGSASSRILPYGYSENPRGLSTDDGYIYQ